MSRFFVTPADVVGKYVYIRDKNDIHHMKKVLRLKAGDTIEVSDSEKWEYECRIEDIFDEEIAALILDKQAFAREPEIEVTLFQGVPKQGKMETIVQKCVELGINSIEPVFMKRCVVTDNGKFFKKQTRWQKVADEAVKQCRRGIIPDIGEGLKFAEMKNRLNSFDLVLFPYENETGYSIKDALRKNLSDEGDMPKTIAVIIGPEGGFADEEAEELKSLGVECVSLGKTILRTETAGMTALAMIMYEYEL